MADHDASGTFNFVDASGQRQDLTIHVTDYKEAGEQGLSLSQHLQRKYPSDPQHGSTFAQCMQSAGLYVRADRSLGIQPPTMKQVLDGNAFILGVDTLRRNDGTDRNTVSGRILYPQVMLEIMEAQLRENREDYLQRYEQLIAIDTTVTSPRVDQPLITTTAPEASAAMNIAQLAAPPIMVSITVSEQSFRIPTKSVGLMISDEALQATTLDLVGLSMTNQARGERIRMVEGQLGAMINGDSDFGESAISFITAQSLDATIDADGEITQKSWVHFLRDNYRTINIDWLLMNIDTAIALENRAGKPNVTTDNPTSPRIDTLFTIENLGLPTPKVLLMDTAFIGANTVVGIDSQYAIRRVTNVSAAYSAIEQWVLRRATAFRIDYGMLSKKLYSSAWKGLTLTVES
jgi:hypothetical protein